jgi:hypothetical protein
VFLADPQRLGLLLLDKSAFKILDFDVDEQSEVEVDLVLLDQWKVAKVKQIDILGHLYTIGSKQCCGSGSVGSVCFCVSWIRIRIN